MRAVRSTKYFECTYRVQSRSPMDGVYFSYKNTHCTVPENRSRGVLPPGLPTNEDSRVDPRTEGENWLLNNRRERVLASLRGIICSYVRKWNAEMIRCSSYLEPGVEFEQSIHSHAPTIALQPFPPAQPIYPFCNYGVRRISQSMECGLHVIPTTHYLPTASPIKPSADLPTLPEHPRFPIQHRIPTVLPSPD